MSDPGAERSVNDVVRDHLAAAAPSVEREPDLSARVAALELRLSTLEMAQLPSVHTHTVLDCHGFIPCGTPGCCAIRCRHS